mgnify:CR=1 FL=1
MVRIATYNVEWFDGLFDDAGGMLEDGGWSGRHDVTRADQLTALGIVFTAMDADAVMIIEAPDDNRTRSTVRALETFAHAYGLRARKALLGFRNATQQEIALLYNPDVFEARHDPQGDETGKKGTRDAPRFDGVFRFDLDIDATPDLIRWSKPPLEVALTNRENGRVLRLIGVHAKSKAPHGASDPDEVMRLAIENRRKQMAQCIWLRQRVNDHLDAGDSLIVMGDFNNNAEESDTWRVATAQGLRDAWVLADEQRGPTATYGDFGPPEGTERVDWILVGGGVDVRWVETVLYNDDGRYPSDHYPVAAGLELQ